MKAIRLFIPRFFLSDQQENGPQKLYFLVVKRKFKLSYYGKIITEVLRSDGL